MGVFNKDKLRGSYDTAQTSSRLNANELKKAFGKPATSIDALNEAVAALGGEDVEATEVVPSRRSRTRTRKHSVTGRSCKSKSTSFTETLSKQRHKRK